jgi:hypothetical protein
LPDLWKLAQITSVFKNRGNAQEVLNHRSISLTSTSILCKIMGKYYSNTCNFLNGHDLLYEYQSGVQHHDSNINQLVEIYNTMCQIYLFFFFCDISKASDKIWHKGLLSKLMIYVVMP